MPGFPSSFGGTGYPVSDPKLTADDNNIRKLLKSWLGGVQYLEDVLQQLYSERRIDTAEGAQLDILGKLVGQKRDGLTDDAYRRYIRARVSTNRSKGTLSEIIKVADLVVFDDDAYLHVQRQHTASYHFKVEDVVINDAALIEALISFLIAASAAGVRPMLETWPEAEAQLFVLGGEGTTGNGKIGLGLGDSMNAATGGGLASAVD